MQAAYLQVFPAQLELITEGDPADFLYVVIEGCVELFARSNGRESTMGMVRPVGSFILAAVLKDAVYLMSARTLKRSKVLMVPSSNIRGIFQKDEAFARAIVLNWRVATAPSSRNTRTSSCAPQSNASQTVFFATTMIRVPMAVWICPMTSALLPRCSA